MKAEARFKRYHAHPNESSGQTQIFKIMMKPMSLVRIPEVFLMVQTTFNSKRSPTA
jgi:hypothetical protein